MGEECSVLAYARVLTMNAARLPVGESLNEYAGRARCIIRMAKSCPGVVACRSALAVIANQSRAIRPCGAKPDHGAVEAGRRKA